MAHFAELDENNVVLRVTCVGNDEVAYNGDPAGEAYCKNLLGGTWKQTSYNTRNGVHYDPNTWTPSADQSLAFRWNYAGPGFTYDAVNDVFYAPQPFPSWTLVNNEWTPPFAKPDEAGDIEWDESLQTWKRYTFTPPEGEEVGPDTPFTTETWNTTTNSFEQD